MPTPGLSVSQLISPPAANVAAQCPQPWGPCQPLDFTEQLWPHLLLQGLPAPTPRTVTSAPLPGGSLRRESLSSPPPRPAVPSWPPAPLAAFPVLPQEGLRHPGPTTSVLGQPSPPPPCQAAPRRMPPHLAWPQVLCDFRLQSSEPRGRGGSRGGQASGGGCSQGAGQRHWEGILTTHFTRCVLGSVARVGALGGRLGGAVLMNREDSGGWRLWPWSESQEPKWGGGGPFTGRGVVSADPRPVLKAHPTPSLSPP